IMPFDHASPIYFTAPSTNTHALVSDLTNTTLLSLYQQNYSAVYIANREPLLFDSPAVINIANLTIVDRSPYGLLKDFLGMNYPSPMYIYKLEE
ncbi:MAG: hypothetical protein AABX82_05250, partial [Nanoarchaeota archaeon]